MSKTTDKEKEPTLEINMPLEKFLAISFLVPADEDIFNPRCIWGLPVMLHGSPGIGKTDRIRQASAAVSFACRSVELGGRQPEDASGAPFLTKEDKLVIACILGAVNELNHIGQGVLFLDELTNARPATQGAFLTAVQERRVGDTQFSEKIRVVCAGNPPHESAGGYILSPPMANRMAHRDVTPPSVDEFVSYLVQGPNNELQNIELGEKKILDGWSTHWPRVKGLLVGYVKSFGDSGIYNMPRQGHPSRGKAFPTPRSLCAAARAVATTRILGFDRADQTEMVAACCGAGSAVHWEEYVLESDLPDPEHALKNGWKVDKDRLDRTIAVFSSMASFALCRTDKKEKIAMGALAWERLGDLLSADLFDLALMPAKALYRGGLNSKADPEIARAARPVLLKLGNTGASEFVEG